MIVDSQALVAYSCEIKYREKRNPLREVLKNQIKDKEKPDYSLEQLLNDFYNHFSESKSVMKDVNNKKVISIEEKYIKYETAEFTRYSLTVQSGRNGMHFNVVKNYDTTQKIQYTNDDSALYPYSVFFYVAKNGSIYAIFHHNGKYSCKTSLQRVFNDFLMSKGLIFNMDVMLCNDMSEDLIDSSIIERITMRRLVDDISSDPADNIKPKKKVLDSELSLFMDSPNNLDLAYEVKKFLKKGTDKGHIKGFINAKIGTSGENEYGNGRVVVNLAGHKKTINFDSFQGTIGEYYITDDLKFNSDGTPDLDNLTRLTDEYYNKIKLLGEAETCEQ